MNLLDEMFDRDGLNDSLSVEHHFQDDPSTIEWGKLDDLSNNVIIRADENGVYHYPSFGYCANNMIIPFKNLGKMTCMTLVGSRLYGTLHGEYPLSYNIGNGVYEKCPDDYFLCTNPRIPKGDPTEWLKAAIDMRKTREGFGNMRELTDVGMQVVKAFAEAQVSAQEMIQGLKLANVKLYGEKLVKDFLGGWVVDEVYLDMSRVLRENPETNK